MNIADAATVEGQKIAVASPMTEFTFKILPGCNQISEIQH